MGFVSHELTHRIELEPEKAAGVMLAAYQKAKCKARDAATLLGVTERTWIRWVQRLDEALQKSKKGGMSERMGKLKERAYREGWHHKDVGGRPRTATEDDAKQRDVEIPAILLLEDRGYAVTVTRSEDVERWTATRGDVELSGEDPLQLLGLASLAEARGPSWRATDEQILDTLARFGIA